MISAYRENSLHFLLQKDDISNPLLPEDSPEDEATRVKKRTDRLIALSCYSVIGSQYMLLSLVGPFFPQNGKPYMQLLAELC